MRRLTSLALLLAVGCGPAADTVAPDPDTAALQAVADEVWERTLDTNIYARMWAGLPFETLPDLSYEEAQAGAEFSQTVLDRLQALDESALSHDDWITWAVLKRQAQMSIEGLQYYWYKTLLNPYS